MLRVPEGIDERFALVVAAEHGGGCGGSHEADAVAQFAEAACLQDLIALRQGAVGTVLVDEGVDSLREEEVLDGLTILALPLAVGTTPLVVEGDVHRHAPGVVAEVVAAIAARGALRTLRHAWETGHLHLATVVLAHVGVQTCLWVDGLVQVFTALLGALEPILGTPVISPFRPYLIEGGDMITGVGITLPETVGGEGDELRLGIDEIHLLRPSLLGTKGGESGGTGLGLVLLRLDAVEDVLRLGLVVDACVVTPAVGGEEEGGDEIEFAVAGSTLRIAGAVGLTTPGEVALADAVLVLHVFLGPSPQTADRTTYLRYGHRGSSRRRHSPWSRPPRNRPCWVHGTHR